MVKLFSYFPACTGIIYHICGSTFSTFSIISSTSIGSLNSRTNSSPSTYVLIKEYTNVVASVSLLDGGSTHVSFNTSIGEWNKQRKLEDPVFAAKLNDKNTSTIDKMNYIGKYVVELKARDEIEAEEFKDIFIQAGLFTSGFSGEKTLNMIYKLLN